MKNDLIEARLRRDTDLLAFLLERRADYLELEDDVAPLRSQLGQNLELAQTLSAEVLTADLDHNTERRLGTRNQLTALLKRLVVALRADATAKADTRLLALAGQPGQLPRLPASAYQDEARRLLSLAPERSAALTKRRFLPTHYTQAQALLQELRTATTEGRLNDTTGSAGRLGLERLIKDNGRLVDSISALLAVYEQDEPEFWHAYRAAARVVRRGGGSGADDGNPKP